MMKLHALIRSYEHFGVYVLWIEAAKFLQQGKHDKKVAAVFVSSNVLHVFFRILHEIFLRFAACLDNREYVACV